MSGAEITDLREYALAYGIGAPFLGDGTEDGDWCGDPDEDEREDFYVADDSCCELSGDPHECFLSCECPACMAWDQDGTVEATA